MNLNLPVVLVDDDHYVLVSSQLLLRTAGIKHVHTLDNGKQLLAFLEQQAVAVVVLDLFMPDCLGSDLLPKVLQAFPNVSMIMMTASDEVKIAVDCMKIGAFDYLVKPVDETEFVSTVKKALELYSLKQEVKHLKQSLLSDDLQSQDVFNDIYTRSRKMRGIFQYIEAVATSSEPVLITGETGVGKELMASAVHKLSGRKGNLVCCNMAGLDDHLFNDTLFGHRKGAYTGANEARQGLITQAEKGSLLLDEIGDLGLSTQVKLLRLLQERKYYPLGADVAKNADVRIIVATHRDLKQLIKDNLFRSDLYYRLSAHQIHIPPLRERKEDIALLLIHFLEKAAQSMNKATPTIPPELMTLLQSYHFPGNVRELRAMVYDAVARHQSGVLSLQSFREMILSEKPVVTHHANSEQPSENIFTTMITLPSLKQAEQQLIEEALRRAENNQGIAAGFLGISRQALNRRLKSKKDQTIR